MADGGLLTGHKFGGFWPTGYTISFGRYNFGESLSIFTKTYC